MIHPSELRIGNKFSKFNQETGTWQLITIGVKDIECAVNFPKVFAAFYEPIKLSPYYLEKLGFEKYQWTDGYFKRTKFGDLMVQFLAGKIYTYFTNVGADSKGMKMFGKIYVGNADVTMNIHHLHHLQNLYLDLSGTELDVPEML